jgi:kynurenine formamidase
MSIPINTVAGPDNANPALHYMSTTHDVDVGSGELLRFATDFLGIQFHGDCHTHIDALCHIAYKGQLYNGHPADLVTSRGALGLDITAYAHGIVGKGVLIDVPRYRGVKWLEPGEAVTREEIEAVEAAEGVRLGEGDILVFRTGHHRRRLELGAWDVGYTGEGRAGLDPYSLTLLHERKVAVFLPDGDGEVVPGPMEEIQYPIHPLQVTAMGMVVADSLQFEDLAQICEQEGRWEFMVGIAPLRLPKATGSPFNPIAIF